VERVANPKLLRERSAEQFVSSIDDPVTKQLVEVPYREVLQRFADHERLPISDFDIAFFVEGLFLSLSCHDRIQGYLNGADRRWFPEDDDEIRDALFCPLPEKAPFLATGHFAFTLDSWVRQHEARWLMGSVGDIAINQIVGVAIAALYRHYHGRPFPGEPKLPQGCPIAPLDILFCAEVLLKALGEKNWLRSTLADREQ
jgi:hypothetical protein